MNKARAFNPFLCAKTDKLMTLIAEVQTQMSGYEAYYGTRKRARRPADQVTYDRTVEAILCDLCAVELGSENDSIHLPLSNKVLRSKSRYKGAKDRVLHSALLFGLLTGMRSGEICGLMAEDITAKGNLGALHQHQAQ